MSKLKLKSTVSNTGVMEVTEFVGDLDMRFKPDGVVDELRIVENEFSKNGLEVDKLGADDGDFGDVDRLRVDAFVLVSIDSVGAVVRACLDKEDIKRLAAAIGPIVRLSLIKLDLLTVEFVDSSLENNSSL